MSNDIQPVADQGGDVVAYVSSNTPIRTGPTLSQIKQRNANFDDLKAINPEECRKIETGSWSPKTDDVLIGDFLGFATMARNPKDKKDYDEIEQMQLLINSDSPEVEHLSNEHRAAYTKEKPQIPFEAVVLDTPSGIRFASFTMMLEKFGSQTIPDGSGVWIKCTHAKAQEMTQIEVRVLREGPKVVTVDTDHSES